MRTRIALIVAAVLVVAVGIGGALWWRQREAGLDAAAQDAATSYANAWAAKDLAPVAFADDAAKATFAPAIKDLGDAEVAVTASDVTRNGDTATATLDVTWTLPGDVPWKYAVPVTLTAKGEDWVVATPSAGSPWHPDLPAGKAFRLERTFGERGDLLDRQGKPLMPLGTVHAVAIDPVNATQESASALEPIVGADKGSLATKLQAATASGSRAPIPVITYRDADWEPRAARIEALDGIIAPTSQQPLGRTRTFAQPVLGTYGEVTAEMVEKSEGRYEAGDRAGRSGLQAQYDEKLAGATGLAVSVSGEGGVTLFEKAATDGADVETTLDPKVQVAAEKALADSKLSVPGAVVAVDVKSGEVLAVANSPTNGFDRALTGKYPPGSTFKVATSYAYLTRGITTPSAKVPCPASVTVDGRTFTNFAGESVSGSPTFFEDFTISCNTAFVGLSGKLGEDDLTTAAKALGIGAGWGETLGVSNTFAGSVPATNGGTDQAAASIGQGRVEVSPVALAVMAGSVGRGTFVPPVLVRGGGGTTRPVALDGTAVGQLRSMMASVVSSGSGTVLRNTPGGPVRGKTGTAEHGNDPDALPRTWFTGYQRGVAFAVLVEEGKSGGTVAAPVAKKFLTNLARD